MSRVSVSARGLTKRYGPVAALRGVDLEVPAGTTAAVLGPNGAGKSTLLRILAGLARPTAGEVEIRDEAQEALGSRAAARGRIGFVGHATQLYPELTARENLRLQGRLHGLADPDGRADVLLEEEGLADAAERRAGVFSRGMGQRLSIARALVPDPPLLLLDEPFSGLDRRSGDRLAERLGRLRAEGRTLVLITHDNARACEVADAAVVLLGGRVLARAAGEELRPEHLDAVQAAPPAAEAGARS